MELSKASAIRKIGTIATMFVALTFSSAQGAIISFASDLVSESNNITGTNVLITPYAGVWAPAGATYFWISYDDTGFNGTVVPPSVTPPVTLPTPNPPTAIFYENFTLNGPLVQGFIAVWADNTARVYLDNLTTVSSILLTDANPDFTGFCANGPVSCTVNGVGVFNLTPLGLLAGNYQVRIEAYQADVNPGPFGVMYAGLLEDTEVPEPSTLGLGFAGLAALWFAKRRTKKA